MTDDQLLKEIQKAKLLDETAANKLRRELLLSGKSLEALISLEGLLDDRKVAELKSAVLKVPYKKIDPAAVDQALLQVIPEETAWTYRVAPISKKDNLFIVGMVSPDDAKAQDALKFLARRDRFNLGVYLISYGDWQEIMRKYSPFRSEI